MEEKSAESFVGLTLEELDNTYANYRVVAEDGEHFIVTADFWRDRLNVEVYQGVVTFAYWG